MLARSTPRISITMSWCQLGAKLVSSRSCQWLKDACANSPILLLRKFGNLACLIFLHLILMALVFDIGNGRNNKQWLCFWSRACTRTLLGNLAASAILPISSLLAVASQSNAKSSSNASAANGRHTTISTMATEISTPNATVYVANIDWKIKKPLLKRALYSLFSRHGKVGLRLWRVLPENVDLFCFIPPNNAVEFASLLRVTLFSHFG